MSTHASRLHNQRLAEMKGFDISECRRCGAPCYVPIMSIDLGLCDDCKRPESPREHYERVLERAVEPLPERVVPEMPNPDRWIEGNG